MQLFPPARPVPMSHPLLCSPVWLAPRVYSSPLAELLSVPMSGPLIDYVVDYLLDTVSASLDRSWPDGQHLSLNHPLLRPTVQNILTKNKCPVSAILVALVYLGRCKRDLRVSTGMWACERALVGALTLANKYTNDDVLSTKAWAMASGIFTPKDVVSVERELLHILNFDLSLRGEELLAHYQPLMDKYRQAARQTSSLKLTCHPLRASVRYSPYQGAARAASTVSACTRRASACGSRSSSCSSSPLDSPQLLTPPDAYPLAFPGSYSVSEAKRRNPPALQSTPYILKDVSLKPFSEIPVNSSNGRFSQSHVAVDRPYAFIARKDIGVAAPAPRPSLLAELLHGLDPQYTSSEIDPSFGVAPSDDVLYRHHMASQYTLGQGWQAHRSQATTKPPSFQPPVYVF